MNKFNKIYYICAGILCVIIVLTVGIIIYVARNKAEAPNSKARTFLYVGSKAQAELLANSATTNIIRCYGNLDSDKTPNCLTMFTIDKRYMTLNMTPSGLYDSICVGTPTPTEIKTNASGKITSIEDAI